METKLRVKDKSYIGDEIAEGNRLIAEFIGKSFEGCHISDFKGRPLPKQISNKLKYNSSWSHLMPVVEEIESIGYDSIIIGNNNNEGFLCVFVDIDNIEAYSYISFFSKIDATWKCVVQFIKWYNQNKQS